MWRRDSGERRGTGYWAVSDTIVVHLLSDYIYSFEEPRRLFPYTSVLNNDHKTSTTIRCVQSTPQLPPLFPAKLLTMVLGRPPVYAVAGRAFGRADLRPVVIGSTIAATVWSLIWYV
jgi:hypothetical protein